MTLRRRPAPGANREQCGHKRADAAGQRPLDCTTLEYPLWISPDWPVTACLLAGCLGAVLAERVRR